MNLAAWILLGVTASMTGAASLIIWWSWRSGQFDDMESVKYRMLQDE